MGKSRRTPNPAAKRSRNPVPPSRRPGQASRALARCLVQATELSLLSLPTESPGLPFSGEFGATLADVGNDTELRTRYSIYPEIPISNIDGPWTSISFPLDPTFQIVGPTDVGNSFLRPERCILWALPISVVEGSSNSDTVAVFSGCRLSNSAKCMIFGQRDVVIPPMATPQWVKVGEWDYHELMNQTFGRALVTVDSGDKQYFEGFVCKAVGLATDIKLRLRVEYTAKQTVPMIVRAPVAPTTVTDTGKFPEAAAVVETLCLYKPLSITHST